jgi:hypothetical protein
VPDAPLQQVVPTPFNDQQTLRWSYGIQQLSRESS